MACVAVDFSRALARYLCRDGQTVGLPLEPSDVSFEFCCFDDRQGRPTYALLSAEDERQLLRQVPRHRLTLAARMDLAVRH